MEKFLKGYSVFLTWIGKAEIVFASFLILGMTFLIVLQIILRSLFNQPLSWMEEAMVYSFVWLIFIGASIGLKMRRHVKIVAIPSILPRRQGLVLKLIANIIVFWLLIVLLKNLFLVIPIESNASTVALPIDLPRSLFFSVALFVSVTLMLITVPYYFLLDLRKVISNSPAKDTPVMNFDLDI